MYDDLSTLSLGFFLSLLETFETPAYELLLSKWKIKPLNICHIEPRIAEHLNLDIVSFWQKNRGTIEKLGIGLVCFLDTIWREEDLFHESR